jgi:hypothetical protein
LSRRGRTGDTARGAINHIDAAGFQLTRKDHGIVHVPALDCAVDGRDTYEQRHGGRHFTAHRFDDLERQAQYRKWMTSWTG